MEKPYALSEDQRQRPFVESLSKKSNKKARSIFHREEETVMETISHWENDIKKLPPAGRAGGRRAQVKNLPVRFLIFLFFFQGCGPQIDRVAPAVIFQLHFHNLIRFDSLHIEIMRDDACARF